MKPAFLTSEYPHSRTGNSGGIGTSIRNLAIGLKNQGLNVSVLVYGQDEDAVFEDGGITIHKIKNKKFPKLSWWLTRKKIEKYINKLVGQNKIDFIEAPDWTGITSFIRPKCPVIVRLHGSDTYFCHLENRPVKWINRFHEKRALKNADRIVSVSAFTAGVTSEIFNIEREIAVIPNCIESNVSPELNSEAEDTIVYFGTLIRKKGMLELPYIFNELIKMNPEAKLMLIGKDSADITTKSTSTWQLMQPLFNADALSNVSYIGSVPHEQIRQHIARATVCIFPTFAEALPVSWLEAMAFGKAVVASDIGWASEIIDDGGDGFLAHPTNHFEFAKKINIVLCDPELRAKMGENAVKKIAAKFETSKVVAQNMELYKSVCG